jgi:rubredoxin
MSKVSMEESVECSECGDFELSKSYNGHSGGIARSEYENIDIPDECPVCGTELKASVAASKD